MIYWRLGSVPGFRRFPHQVRVEMVDRWRLHSPVLRKIEALVAFGAFFLSMTGAGLLVVLFATTIDGPIWGYLLVWPVCLVLVSVIVIPPIRVVFLRLCMQRMIRKAVAQGWSRYCNRCGYDLRGSPGGACPECGLAIPMAGPKDCPKRSETLPQ